MRQLERSRIGLTAWAIIGFAAMAVAVLYVFVGSGPLAGRAFQLRALVRSDAQLVVGSPVRIAGVDVGTVTSTSSVTPRTGVGVVVMDIDSNALPIHADATMAIRSRLLLEGNFFIDLKPGTPSAPDMASGGTIGVSHTSGPVQLDRVLSTLPADTRLSLRTFMQGLGQSLGATSQGESTAVVLNRSLTDLPSALTGTAQTMTGLRGDAPHDLSRLVRGTSDVLGTLAGRQADLAGLVTNLNRTLTATASHGADLSRSLQLLPAVLRSGDSALAALDRAFPSTRAFARELTPSITQLPAALDAAFPWVDQATKLLSTPELGGLLVSLTPAARDTASALTSAPQLFGQLDLVDRCLIHNFVPAADTVINDPPQPTGGTVAQEFFQTIVGVVGAGQNFDGNGRYLRAQPSGGAYSVQTSAIPAQGPLLGNATNPPLGTRPAWPGSAPPFRVDVACAANQPPNLNSARTGSGP